MKCVWIDKANMILSFHNFESGELCERPDSEFWDWIMSLINAGYRVM